jgi:probable rRNA maturation factor
MSLDVDVSINGLRAPISRAAIADVVRTVLRAERAKNALISITFLDRAAIGRLNVKHLGHTGPTDVISFGFSRATPRDPVVGDIYIAPDVGRANARARHVPVREEMVRLVVHGTLHILGFEHPEDEGRETSAMWLRQERFVKRLMRKVSKPSVGRSIR